MARWDLQDIKRRLYGDPFDSVVAELTAQSLEPCLPRVIERRFVFGCPQLFNETLSHRDFSEAELGEFAFLSYSSRRDFSPRASAVGAGLGTI
jgi:hypothetical protein